MVVMLVAGIIQVVLVRSIFDEEGPRVRHTVNDPLDIDTVRRGIKQDGIVSVAFCFFEELEGQPELVFGKRAVETVSDAQPEHGRRDDQTIGSSSLDPSLSTSCGASDVTTSASRSRSSNVIERR